MSTATDLVTHMRDYFLGHNSPEETWAEDLVIETPFAPPGHPRRFEGRQAFLDATRQERESFPVRFDEMRDVTVHDAGDTLVIEYELAATLPGTGQQESARFIAVARMREGKVAYWREYQDTRAVAEALARITG
ncbi:nuclear transport factor 2 family protein [Actinophytocola xanthii]|uniref:SnoaL-like domain-containing protein n=1 Tax=Actinophytocola xanthii TaxID=1912961 RepID=A0A1Q8C3N1_9PSEU|nr:nuclear transport factor 2 family protein [Actinophytocola xanthii]OLF08970.1 hypothetical protein BU204_33450 [Actinophytocola xanthii]